MSNERRYAETMCYASKQGAVGTVTVYDGIGCGEDFKGVPGSWVADQIQWMDEDPTVARIALRLNSEGGYVKDGYTILAAIQRSSKPVDTYNDGLAASIAAILFQAGEVRNMGDHALLMFHAPMLLDGSDDPSIPKFKDSLVGLVAGRMGKPVADVEASLFSGPDQWFSTTEAITNGLADTSFKMIKASAAVEVMNKDTKSIWASFNKVLAQGGLGNQLNNSMDKHWKALASALKLEAEAEPSVVVNAVQDAMGALHKQVVNLTSERDTLKTEVAAQSKAVADLTTELDSLKLAAITTKAAQLVDKAIEDGKIQEASKEKWNKLAIDAYESAEALLADLPVNKKGVHFPEPTHTDPTPAATTNAGAAMVAIAQRTANGTK